MIPALVLALTSHAVPGAAPVSAGVWRALRPTIREGQESILAFAEQNFKPADVERVRDRLELLEDAFDVLERYTEFGIDVVTEFDDEYPAAWKQKLRDRHPPMVIAAGSRAVLREPMIGVVGSRDIDEAGSAFAREVSARAVGLGYGVVSGGARGVDQISMRAAFEAGGQSVGILADSLLRTVKQSREALESGRVCLVTPYAPDAPFNAGNAMSRNRLIYSLSDATVVVASALGSGGTWNGAVEALDQRLTKLLVRPGLEGNEGLIAKGGIRLPAPADLKDALGQEPFVDQPSLL